MRLVVVPDAEALAARAAAELARRIRADGELSLAVSGGSTPRLALELLAGEPGLDWRGVRLFQVDERLAPEGHEDRNATMLQAALLDRVDVGELHLMPADGDAAAYAQGLPESLDVVQLGLGDDGHTASLVPDDPVLEVGHRRVAVTGEYRGWPRMTLTYPALDEAGFVLWVVAGAEKADALSRLLAGDRSIPAGRVAPDRALVLADRAAMGG